MAAFLRSIVLCLCCRLLASLQYPPPSELSKRLHLEYTPQNPWITSRRIFVLAGAAGLSSFANVGPASAEAVDPFVAKPRLQSIVEKSPDWTTPSMTTTLGSRIVATELPAPAAPLPFSDPDLFYPDFLFGAWQVNATLRRKEFPYGTNFVPSVSLVEGSPRNRNEQVGDVTQYQLHYFSTLANTPANQMTVNLGLGVPRAKIIADRAYNAISMSKAYRQLLPIQAVDWDPRKDPARMKLEFASLTDDLRPLGPRRGEVYFTSRQSEQTDSVFCASEQSRSVTLGSGTAMVSDMESITEFRRDGMDLDRVSAVSRVAVYLTPNPNSREGVLWSQVGGKAVAFYDYELQMKRLREELILPDGSKTSSACVVTPKDILQCQ